MGGRRSLTKHMQVQQRERHLKGNCYSKCWPDPCGWGSPGIISEAFKPPLQSVNLRVTTGVVVVVGGVESA